MFKDGVQVGSKMLKNRVLDNYLDLMCQKILPQPDRDTLFPDLSGSSFQTTPYVYLRFGTTQSITDASTTMTYDEEQIYDEYLTMQIATEYTVNLATVYTIDVSAYSTDLYGVGFGQAPTGINAITDYLVAFLDTEDAKISMSGIDELQIIRVDEFEADGTLIPGTYISSPFHLDYWEGFGIGIEYWSLLDVIYMSDSTTASTEDDSYDIITDLTITHPDTGQLTFTGFTNWAYDSGATPTQYQTTGFKYQVQTWDGMSITDYDTYVYYKDLGVETNDGGTVTVTYTFERK